LTGFPPDLHIEMGMMDAQRDLVLGSSLLRNMFSQNPPTDCEASSDEMNL
jgi:hypothetical protein